MYQVEVDFPARFGAYALEDLQASFEPGTIVPGQHCHVARWTFEDPGDCRAMGDLLKEWAASHGMHSGWFDVEYSVI